MAFFTFTCLKSEIILDQNWNVTRVVIPTPFTRFGCKYPQIKAENLNLTHILIVSFQAKIHIKLALTLITTYLLAKALDQLLWDETFDLDELPYPGLRQNHERRQRPALQSVPTDLQEPARHLCRRGGERRSGGSSPAGLLNTTRSLLSSCPSDLFCSTLHAKFLSDWNNFITLCY